MAGSLFAAIKALKTSLAKNKVKSNTEVNESLAILQSFDSSEPSASSLENLKQLFSRNIISLYKTQPKATLKLAAAFVAHIYATKIAEFWDSADEDVASGHSVQIKWENLMDEGVFVGLQDYIGTEENDMEALASAFYPILCQMICSKSSSRLSPSFRRQICSILSDSSRGHENNAKLLRSSSRLGPTRLGECIASTQDYLLLDALFELIGRLTPSSKKPKERRTFCVDVFQNEAVHRAFGLEASTKLCETLEAAVGGAWEKASYRMFHEIGARNLDWPQAFKVDEIRVHGSVYSQMSADTHVYVDRTGFVADIPDKEGELETLEVRFSAIRSLAVEKATVSAVLSSSPLLQLAPMEDPPKQSKTYMKFILAISPGDRDHFRAVLAARGQLPLNTDGSSATINHTSSLPTASKTSLSKSAIGCNTLERGTVRSLEPLDLKGKSAEIEDLLQNTSFSGASSSPAKASKSRPEFLLPQSPSKGNKALHGLASKTSESPRSLPPSSPVKSPAHAKSTTSTDSDQPPALDPSCDHDLMEVGKKSAPKAKRVSTLGAPEASSAAAKRSAMNPKHHIPPIKQKAGAPSAKSKLAETVGEPLMPRSTRSAAMKAAGKIKAEASKRLRSCEPESDDDTPSPKRQRRHEPATTLSRSDSKYLKPSHTAAARATSKYSGRAKKARISSPDSFDSDDAEPCGVPPGTKWAEIPPIDSSRPRRGEKRKETLSDKPRYDVSLLLTTKSPSEAGNNLTSVIVPSRIARVDLPSSPSLATDDAPPIADTSPMRPLRKENVDNNVIVTPLHNKVNSSDRGVDSDDVVELPNIKPALVATMANISEKRRNKKAPWETPKATEPAPEPRLPRGPSDVPAPVAAPVDPEVPKIDMDRPWKNQHVSGKEASSLLSPLDDRERSSSPNSGLGKQLKKTDASHNTTSILKVPVAGPKEGVTKRRGAQDTPQSTAKEDKKHRTAGLAQLAADVTTIDLTEDDGDDTKVDRSEPVNDIFFEAEVVPDLVKPFSLKAPTQPDKISRPRPSVTFAKDVSGHSVTPSLSPSPTPAVQFIPGRLALQKAQAPRQTMKPEAPQIKDGAKKAVKKTSQKDSNVRRSRTDGREVNEDIILLLNKIQDIVVQQMEDRFVTVRHEVRSVRSRIFEEARSNLAEIHEASVDQYNQFVGLEESYGQLQKGFTDDYSLLRLSNDEISSKLRQVVQDHDRNSLANKMPASPFRKALPSAFQALGVTL